MYPILLRAGSFTLYSYTVALVAGMALGAWVTYSRAREARARPQAHLRVYDPALILDAGFWVLLGGILGARIAYVAANWAYYADHLGKAVNVSEGGLVWHGALIGGTAALAVWSAARRRRIPPGPGLRVLLDLAAPGIALGGSLGWLGALLTGSSYGAEAGGVGALWVWLTARLPDIYGVVAVRFMTQPVMIAVCLLLGALLWAGRGRLCRGPGLTFAIYLAVYALADFCVWFARGDGTWRWGLWLWQWVALVELGAAIGLGVYAWRQRRG